MNLRRVDVKAGEPGVFVLLHGPHEQVRLYQIDSSEGKGSAQLSEVKSPTKEIVLERLRVMQK